VSKQLGHDALSWLEDAASLLADAAAWIAPSGQREPRVERWARSIDWSLARAWEPGQCRTLSAEHVRRSARETARATPETWVRPRAREGGREGGLLVLRTGDGRAVEATGALALAELCARASDVEHERELLAHASSERSIGRRAAGLTHDLRNQLTLALCQLERVRASAGEHSLGDLERVLEGARELCALSLRTRGKHTQARSILLRSVLVDEARAARGHARRGDGVRVLVRCPVDLQVRADLAALTRLVRNLLSNALEASFPESEVRVDASADGAGVVLSVRDSGRGIAPERAAELFTAGVSGSGGSGWGTSVVCEALADLDAELELESEPGRGTCVSVRLLAARPTEQARCVYVDPDRARRERRAARLEEVIQGVLVCARAEQALGSIELSSLEAIVVARGLAGTEVHDLRERAMREGVRWIVASALDPDGRALAESLRLSLASSGSHARTRD
jgi:signal transduction histidine kinase